eukprot:GFUD01069103.1.p1 GENE.GFUD01069103.1~~GFUD01069103.1.p1  ORF type:complete len:411 (-),score=98.02 GFUD01069103.1:90-1232(-)
MIQEVEEKYEQEHAEESKKLIIELGLKYKLASKYTSFVGVDEKQGNHGNFMIRRHIKNQMPQNSGFGFGGFASSSNAVIDSVGQSRGLRVSCCSGAPSPPPPGQRVQMMGGPSMGLSFGSAAPPPPPGSASFGSTELNQRCSLLKPPMFGSTAAACSAGPPPGAMLFGGMQECSNSADSFTFGGVTPINLSNDSFKTGQSSSSDVLKLTMCQAANGSFPPQPDIASILGVELEKVFEAGKAVSSDATWMTVVVVAFLTENCKEEKDVWELVVEKAQRWLQNNAGFVSFHLEKAKEFLLQTIPVRKASGKTCPQGHVLSLVTTRDGSPWHCDSMTLCVGGCNGDGEHPHQSVWRCSHDWRVTSGGTCDFDLCGECVKQNRK